MFTHEDLDYAQGTQLRLYARNIGLKGRSKLKVKQLRDALRATLPPREGTPPGLFVELCAGTAAVSLQLHREGARPPVSRMGSKRGYAIAVLHALGLHPGLQADRYLWCEPDDGCRLLLETYRDHDLALKVAEIIRGWKDEDPRSLWERLRKEGPVKAPTPREVARWTLALPGGAWTCMPPKAMYKGPGCYSNRPEAAHLPRPIPNVAAGYEDLDTFPAEVTDGAVDPREVARWCWLVGHTDPYGKDLKTQYKPDAEGRDTWKPPPRDWLATRCEDLDELPAEVTDEAVDPREAARWFIVQGWTRGGGDYYSGPGRVFGSWDNPGWDKMLSPQRTAEKVEQAPTLPGEITDKAVEPPLLPPNTVVYIDPPYVNTTGYKHDLPRERVVELALAWYAAGAKVAISEQEAIPELIAQGWTAVDITDKRLGQKRTFSVQKTEYLTLSPGTKCSNHLT